MKTQLVLLVATALAAMPGATHAQGTYLSAPDGNPTNALNVANDGNIGVGTTNPASALEVLRTNSSGIEVLAQFSNPSGVAGTGAGIAIGYGTSTNTEACKIAAIYERSFPLYLNPALTFWTRHSGETFEPDAERMRISSDGKVGIGTPTPTERMDILDGNLVLGSTHDLDGFNNYGSLKFRVPNSTGEFISLRSSRSGTFGNSGNRYSLAVDLLNDDTSEFSITRQIVGPVFGVRASGQTFIGGNLGIGTALPQAKLHVSEPYAVRVAEFESARSTCSIGLDAKGAGGRKWVMETSGGSFNIADATANADRFLIDQSGNVGIGNNSPSAKLDVNGKINCTVLELTSDRNAKAGFSPVDHRDVLQKVAQLPLSTWHHTNAPGVRHLGPMAQDFHAAFHLGTDDKHITTVDADGVLFASVQALHEELQETKAQLAAKDSRITTLEKELADQKHALAQQQQILAARFSALETRVTTLQPKPDAPALQSSHRSGTDN